MPTIRRNRRGPEQILEDQWTIVALHERLTRRKRVPTIAAALQGEARAAKAELAPLARWELISERSYATYLGDANHLRLRRLLDYIHDGDRVLDVGIGFGYVTGILHRERRLEHYCGIDLKDQFLAAANSMAAANALALSASHLEVKDVLDVTPEWMAPHRPDVVLVLEVLEHIPDPLAALGALAQSVPEHATVLFTVPMVGRLEGVWGHVSLFDKRRVEELCAHVGLHIHYVEPVFSTWLLVAASRASETPVRLRPVLAAAARPSRVLRGAATRLPERTTPGHSVVTVPMHHRQRFDRPQDDPDVVTLTPRQIGVDCRVVASAAEPAEGGVRLPMPTPGFLRLELTFHEPEAIEEAVVSGLGADDAEHVRWRWGGDDRHPVDGVRKTHLLHAHESSGPFRLHAGGSLAAADVVEVAVRVRRGATAGFRLHRAAYATGSSRQPPA